MPENATQRQYDRLRGARSDLAKVFGDVAITHLHNVLDEVLDVLIEEFGSRPVAEFTVIGTGTATGLGEPLITDHPFVAYGNFITCQWATANGRCGGSYHDHTRSYNYVITNEPNRPCAAALNIKGEHFPCDWPTDRNGQHRGWAHANKAAQAIWGNGDD